MEEKKAFLEKGLSLKGKLGRPRRCGNDEIRIYQIEVKIELDLNLDSVYVSVFGHNFQLKYRIEVILAALES
jgi:hypothetical protein